MGQAAASTDASQATAKINPFALKKSQKLALHLAGKLLINSDDEIPAVKPTSKDVLHKFAVDIGGFVVDEEISGKVPKHDNANEVSYKGLIEVDHANDDVATNNVSLHQAVSSTVEGRSSADHKGVKGHIRARVARFLVRHAIERIGTEIHIMADDILHEQIDIDSSILKQSNQTREL